MLENLSGRVSDRKLRLFACACVRRIWHLVIDDRSRESVEVSERYADGKAVRIEVAAVIPAALVRAASSVGLWDAHHAAVSAASLASSLVARGNPAERYNSARGDAEKAEQAHLLRHIVGNPFRARNLLESCPLNIVNVAEALYLGVPCPFALHDALLEAGHPELAAHFREPEHPKGCWALDLILGKS